MATADPKQLLADFIDERLDGDDDLAEAERYIDFSKQVIDYRSERIIAKLKFHL